MLFNKFLLVAVGGALGSVMRYACTIILGNKNFPINTLIVNLVGSFVIGFVMSYCSKHATANYWQLLLVTGVCGGFTTFSAFSYEVLMMLQQGKFVAAIAYIVISIIFSILFVAFGFALGK